MAARSAEDYFDAKTSLMSAIDWAKRQSATLFELKAATDLAELLLNQGALPEAYRHLGAALDRMPAKVVSPAHRRALQIFDQLQSGTTAVGIAHVPAKHALGLDPRVESGSPTRTCANTRIYGASRSYWITE